jgi:sterol desaturase/sphingolipid hydroxylase (fatty acid hydroxylase superfamily)
MEAILTVLMPLTFVLMIGVERVFPARPLPRVRRWALKCITLFFVLNAVAATLPALAAMAVGAHAPLNLKGLGTVGGGIVAFLVSDLVFYGAHRLVHNVPLLWRWIHQMHHSAERIDVLGSNYGHPFDVLALGGVTVLAVTLLGVSPDAAALAGFIGFFLPTFQHMNVRTPQWLGWIIQRPEAHTVHHSRGVHAYNYGNVMLWDIVLGTFRNPAAFGEQAGFWDGASTKMGAMLIGRDVSQA